MEQSDDQPAKRLFLLNATQIAAWLVGLAIVIPVEIGRFSDAVTDGNGPTDWLTNWNVDTTAFLFLFLLAPGFWFWKRHSSHEGRGNSTPSRKIQPDQPKLSPWILAAIVVFSSCGASLFVATRPVRIAPNREMPFGELPPAYHDEYSYLFQAQTFLAGRWSYPSHPVAPALFDQVHVLNEDRFASRYFPGAGAWLAAFVAVDRPYWGHWLAGALTALFLFWSGRELGGDGVGFIAGLLTAIAPGMAIFSNLLLAHHPTLVGLSIFLFAFLRMMRTREFWCAGLAGAGLSFAMLCRPMSAAGFALPFGLWLIYRIARTVLLRGDETHSTDLRPLFGRHLLVMGIPLLVGFAVSGMQNRAITGDWLTTPYQLYTEIYTPRHVYGFDNVKRGEQKLGPKVLESYDRWAENLTPARAVENVEQRLIASWQWTFGIVPLAITSILLIGLISRLDRRVWLIIASIVSLHAAHVPYWYDGIMHYHYVFESGPLWLLLFASVSGALWEQWNQSGRSAMPVWWCGFTAVPFVVAYTTLEWFDLAAMALVGELLVLAIWMKKRWNVWTPIAVGGAGVVATALLALIAPGPLWPQTRIEAAVDEIAFSRRQYLWFDEMIDRRLGDESALLLIDPGRESRHIDFVVNNPALDDQVLRGRWRPSRVPMERVRLAFPERNIYRVIIDPGGWRIEPIDHQNKNGTASTE